MTKLVYGVEIISKNPLPEFNAVGIYARHKKTGLELYHILNDDKENLFSYNFITPVNKSNGIAHIIEHTVLCGSKNYPLKDPFIVLEQQSIKTFLNAMTCPDKTLYPASSISETDYFNLMQVYGDAVFFPLLEEWAFKQEGHRFEIEKDGKVTIQGVVLNEMRAYYSDFDNIMYNWSYKAICQGSIYENDSGGNPLEIPNLTYEEYKAFYKKYYHPVNCKIFLMGNIPTEKQMKFIDEKFLSKFEYSKKLDTIQPIPKYKKPLEFRVPAPATESDDLSKEALMISWLLFDSSDTEKFIQAILLEIILLGHDGSCLNKIILDSDFAENMYPYNGFSQGHKNVTFIFAVKGVSKNKKDEFKSLVFNALNELVKSGIPKTEIETALHCIEFSLKEVKAGIGLIALERAMSAWAYGKNPETAIQYVSIFEKIKKQITSDERYFEKLIQKYLIDNQNYALTEFYPDPNFCNNIDNSLKQRAEEFEKTLTPEKREAFIKTQKEENKFKQSPDSPELLARIPNIKLGDLPELEAPASTELTFINEVPVFIFEQPTNEIAYMQMFFPIDHLTNEECKYLPLLVYTLMSIGTEKLSWSETSSKFANLFGAFNISPCIFQLTKIQKYLF